MIQCIDSMGIGRQGTAFSSEGRIDTVLAGQEQEGNGNSIKKLNYEGDLIEISEEAKKLAVNRKEACDEPEAGTKNEAPEGAANMDQVQKIREQIQEVQQKLQEAQQRLIEAQANENNDGNADDSESDRSQKAVAGLLSHSSEVEQIRSEIEMLNQQLMTLNDQLKEAMQGMK